jgi:hypothetical protein
LLPVEGEGQNGKKARMRRQDGKMAGGLISLLIRINLSIFHQFPSLDGRG